MDPGPIVEKSSYAMILTGVATIVSLLFIKAPYGRYSTDKGWGFLVPAKVAWIMMESPNLWIAFVTFVLNFSNNNLSIQPNRILMLCFVLHYINRAIVFPLSMKASNPMPVSVMLMAMFYCTWNGFNQATQLLLVKAYPEEWIYDPRFIVGVVLFYWGFWVNIQSDHILVNLRKGSETGGEKKYVIPKGGWFEYVSCANYFGEIVEWFGFACACWSLPAVAFAFFTFCNLAPRAIKHHNWYKEKFEDYPKKRKAVIPFVI